MPVAQTSDGVALHYKTVGEGPLSLLFMHGWGGSGRYFNDLIGHLDLRGLRIITFDFRGHGDSDMPTHGFSLDIFAQDTLAVADHAHAERLILIGFSMSGKFAQYITAHLSEHILGQILLAPAPASELALPPEIQQQWVEMAGDAQAVKQMLPQFCKAPPQEELLERFAQDFVKASPEALNETLNMCKESFVDDLGWINTPTLVIGGLHDPLLPADLLRQSIVEPIKGARLAWLNCGHETPMEMPQESAALIEAFLAGLKLPN